MTATPHPGPLSGLKVVELSLFMAGPTCGLMIADMGADVIKVERIGVGDDSRRMVPPTIKGEAASFMMMNRNKRGIAVDLKHKDGVAVVRRLIARADVVLENFRGGTMDRLGLGYETLRKDNPGLIYAEISGFGRTGPYADRAGLDLIAQAMSGLMSITGEGPGRPPVKVGAPLTDITAGILAAMGVVAAYVHRLKTGEGQRVDTSLIEAGITHTYWQAAMCLATGISPQPMGSAHPLGAPYQAFPASDGWFVLGAPSQGLWERLVEMIGAPELAADPRFKDNAGRKQNYQALAELLSPIFRRRPRADWLEALERAGIPAGPVQSIGDMLADPQTLAREMVVETDHARAGRTRALGFPVKFSRTPGRIGRAAPVIGQHSAEILGEIGYSRDEIAALVKAGAVGVADSDPSRTEKAEAIG